MVFRGYVALLVAGLGAALASTSSVDNYGHRWSVWILLAVLFALTEGAALSFYDAGARLGLSASEAILLPMVVVLTPPQVIVAAALGMAAIRFHEWGKTPLKETFNVAQYGVAAAGGMWVWNALQDHSSIFSTLDALAAIGAVLSFHLLTHTFVSIGLQVVGRARFIDAFKELGPAAIWNLAGNVILGLFFAAAYLTAGWTLVLFPLALGGLYIALRAILAQRTERERVERLHAASQALAGSPDLGDAIKGFLIAIARMVSAKTAWVALETQRGRLWSGVESGEVIADLELLESGTLSALLEDFGRDTSPLMSGALNETRQELVSSLPSTSLIAVPILIEGEVKGCLTILDREGADDFQMADVRLLEALAHELALAVESRRLFDEVETERERFRLLVESVKDYAIFMLDPEGHVVSWNAGAERIKGYAAEEIIGQHVSRFYPPEEHDAWAEESRIARAQGHVESEGLRLRKDGSRYLAHVLVSPVLDPSGELQGYAEVIRDVTERAQAQKEKEALHAQLHQAQKLETVGRLAGGIAHDFNNLLSVMLNYSKFVLDEVTDEAVREDVTEIKAAAERAAALTRQLLIFSRKEIPAPQVLDLNSVVTGVEKLLRRSIGEDIALQTRLDPQLGHVRADPGQMEQVLLNLAINARDAMTGGGSLIIESESVDLGSDTIGRATGLAPGSYVRLRVTDTGSGMTPDVKERAFEPFFTTKPKEVGTGLGLATVYGIVRQSGGHIAVETEPGLGTTFSIYLPVTTDVMRAVGQDEAPSVAGRGETVLVVEDQDAVRAVAKRILANNGYEVVEARSGREALAKVANTPNVDLLLSDVVMPQMSGIELVERMSAAVPDLKVAYMSGYNEMMSSAQGPLEEAAVLIQKPFTEAELLQKVREALEK